MEHHNEEPQRPNPYSNFEYDSALSVQAGVGSPNQVNNAYLERVRAQRQQQIDVDTMANGIRQGDRTMLSRAITLVESTLHEHQKRAQEVIERCLPYRPFGESLPRRTKNLRLIQNRLVAKKSTRICQMPVTGNKTE